VELLKTRIDFQIPDIEIMLKDMSESRRITNKYAQTGGDAFSGVVVSDIYWPISYTDLRPPDSIISSMESFEKSFSNLKASRALTWIPAMGAVDIEIESPPLRLVVTPIQASMLLLFSNDNLSRDQISMSECKDQLKIDDEAIEKAIDFWHSHGILMQVGDHIVSITTCSKERIQELDKQPKTTLMQAEKVLSKSIEYLMPMVKAMLKNRGPMPLNMIHMTLSMLCSDPYPYELSEMELSGILELQVTHGELEYEGQRFKMPL
jgi:anaphase-promoting complex subunit 2